MAKIQKVAVANRGEVAVRILQACHELGLETVLLHSKADIKSRAYRLTQENICIGESPVGESYLSIKNTMDGFLASGADAVHPGFGFLSENADFAKAVEESGKIFIGPSSDVIHKMGDKIAAKALIEASGLPTVPGYSGDNQDVSHLAKEARAIGYPVIAKAAAGGGGRGMKIIRSEAEAVEQIEAAKREGLSAFGSDRVFLEKYLDRAKHIEVQIFADPSGQAVHLFDRECSVQRRHQKIVEEAVSGSISADLRNQLCQAAVTLAKKAGYLGAGTVEFLVQDNQFYFLEMNTRLQVEHPVTELVLGVDLVKAQILSLDGRMACWPQEALVPRGHSIECRIYAEDPWTPGIPSTGPLGAQRFPEGPGRRFDYAFEAGDTVTSFYDSMIAKVIVWDETRNRCIQKMVKVLEDCVVFGVKTNIPLLKQILLHPEFVDGSFTTQFMATHFPEGAHALEDDEDLRLFAEKAFKQVAGSGSGTEPKDSVALVGPSPFQKHWRGM